jgi:hypothetical protein
MDPNIAELHLVLHEVSVMGANDSEVGDISRLIQQVEGGRLDPRHAVATAQQIRDRKQSYH